MNKLLEGPGDSDIEEREKIKKWAARNGESERSGVRRGVYWIE